MKPVGKAHPKRFFVENHSIVKLGGGGGVKACVPFSKINEMLM